MKTCRVCGVELISGENWYKSRESANSKICKKCNTEDAKKYFNKDTRKSWEIEYRLKNKDRINLNARVRGVKNRHRQITNGPLVFITSTCRKCGKCLICGYTWHISRVVKNDYICNTCSNNQILDSCTPTIYIRKTDPDKPKVEITPEYFREKMNRFREDDPDRYRRFYKFHNKRKKDIKIDSYLNYRKERELLNSLLTITT